MSKEFRPPLNHENQVMLQRDDEAIWVSRFNDDVGFHDDSREK